MTEQSKPESIRMGGEGMLFEIAVVLEPDEGGFFVYVPALPGCLSEGATREEALQNIREAAALYIESLIAHGEPIPVGSHETYKGGETHIVRVCTEEA